MEVRRRAAEVSKMKIEAIRRKSEAKSVKAVVKTKKSPQTTRDSSANEKSPVQAKVLKAAPMSVASKRSLKKVNTITRRLVIKLTNYF